MNNQNVNSEIHLIVDCVRNTPHVAAQESETS